VQKAKKAEAKKLVARIIELAEKAYGEVRRDTTVDPLETVLVLILAEGATLEKARKARHVFEEEFVDINELRVSPPSQVAELIAGIGDEENKALYIKRFLERLYNHQHCIDFSFFSELSAQGARAYLEDIESIPERIIDNIMMRYFNEGILPVDAAIARVAHRIGLTKNANIDDVTVLLKSIMLKRQVLPFYELIEQVAHEVCLVSVKHCKLCPLSSVCAMAKIMKEKAKAKARKKTKAKSSKKTARKKTVVKKKSAKKVAKKTVKKSKKSEPKKAVKKAAKKTAKTKKVKKKTKKTK